MKTHDPNLARVFFALWPQASVQRELHALGAGYRLICDARAMRLETLHMTLLFLGEVSRTHFPQLMQAAAKIAIPSFSIELNQLSFWQHNRLAYATLQGETKLLVQLASALRQELIATGIPFKNHAFVPHVTLLRNVRRILELQSIKPITWRVDSFVLVESVKTAHGISYQIVKKWPLLPLAIQ